MHVFLTKSSSLKTENPRQLRILVRGVRFKHRFKFSEIDTKHSGDISRPFPFFPKNDIIIFFAGVFVLETGGLVEPHKSGDVTRIGK